VDPEDLNSRIERAAEAVPEIIDNYIKHDDTAHARFHELMAEQMGETFADLLALMIALAEHAATESGIPPNPDPNNPEFRYAIRVYGRDGQLKNPDDEPKHHVWSTRFIAGVWANDVAQVDALFHVFVTVMDTEEQSAAIRSVLQACSQITHAARQQKEGDR
jgi:hypothetical protein